MFKRLTWYVSIVTPSIALAKSPVLVLYNTLPKQQHCLLCCCCYGGGYVLFCTVFLTALSLSVISFFLFGITGSLLERELPNCKSPDSSGVPRVSSARGPMLGSAPPPPPPRLVNPASAPGEKIDKQRKRHPGTKKTPREIGALESSGPVAFAPLKFAPTSWAGAPSKACARGPCPPCPPPPRYATARQKLLKKCLFLFIAPFDLWPLPWHECANLGCDHDNSRKIAWIGPKFTCWPSFTQGSDKFENQFGQTSTFKMACAIFFKML